MKVLVVDDDQRIVKTTCDILKIKGYAPVAAYSGEEAIEKVKAEAPECVLMDIKMPGISGVEAHKKIKEISPSLPVVLISAYATDELVEEAKKQGVYAVLDKPINFQILLTFLDLLKKEESILIVDDDPRFSKTVRDVLELEGFRVETESEPEKVPDYMAEDYKLVVLLDIKLGDADGLETLKSIRAKYPTKPVVLVTGYREEMSECIEKGLKIGAYTCLYKPLEIDSLAALIEEISKKKLQAVLVQERYGTQPNSSDENR